MLYLLYINIAYTSYISTFRAYLADYLNCINNEKYKIMNNENFPHAFENLPGRYSKTSVPLALDYEMFLS